MPLNDQDIRALTYLAARCRPSHAPRWDEVGIAAAIAKVRNLHLADVALSVIRAADDPKAQTPGVIANTSAPNWQERGTRPVPHEPFDPTTACDTCSQPAHRHAATSGHEFVSVIEAARRRDDAPKTPLRELLAAATPGCPSSPTSPEAAEPRHTRLPRTKEVPQ